MVGPGPSKLTRTAQNSAVIRTPKRPYSGGRVIGSHADRANPRVAAFFGKLALQLA
jgi:hypothetical protein